MCFGVFDGNTSFRFFFFLSGGGGLFCSYKVANTIWSLQRIEIKYSQISECFSIDTLFWYNKELHVHNKIDSTCTILPSYHAFFF